MYFFLYYKYFSFNLSAFFSPSSVTVSNEFLGCPLLCPHDRVDLELFHAGLLCYILGENKGSDQKNSLFFNSICFNLLTYRPQFPGFPFFQ